MKQYIRRWISSHGVQMVLNNKRVESKGLTYEVYEFSTKDDKFHVCRYIYDDYRLWPISGESNLLALGQGLEEISSLDSEELDFEEMLSNGRVTYNSLDEWRKNRPQDVSEKDMEEVLQRYYGKVEEDLKAQSFVEFSVASVEMKESIVIVYFMKSGKLQSPLKLQLGEPSLVKRRNYGNMTSMFEEFVEGLGDVVGGIIWR